MFYHLLIPLLHAFIVVAQNTTTGCGQFFNRFSPSGSVDVNNNAWNATSDGLSCITFNEDVSAFNVTWKWPSDPFYTHSYPHIKFLNELLPISISDISSLDMAVHWTYDADPSIIGNVAIDMFADVDPVKAQNESLAGYELMIWLADYGGPYPLGYEDGIKDSLIIGDVTYNLFIGTARHRVDRITMSWLASKVPVYDIEMDISPLITHLSRFMTENVTLGAVQFGAECFRSVQNSTWIVSDYSLAINGNTNPKPRGSSSSGNGGSSSNSNASNGAGSHGLSSTSNAYQKTGSSFLGITTSRLLGVLSTIFIVYS